MSALRRVALALSLAAVLVVPASASAGVIVGGQDAPEGKYPYAAYLEAGAFACGGTLIEKRWILTAAHCVDALTLAPGNRSVALPGPLVSARVGSSEWWQGGSYIRARRTLIHPDYKRGQSYADVGLVELAADADYPTVKIAGAGEESLWAPGTLSTIIGWGNTVEGDDSSAPDRLQEAQVPIVSDADCARTVGSFDVAVMLCAGFLEAGGVDSCQGDSGGPLLVPGGSALRIAGVVSFGDGCARPNAPGVYSRMGAASLRDWVAGFVPSAVGAPEPQPVVAQRKARAAKRAKAKRASAAKRKRAAARRRAHA